MIFIFNPETDYALSVGEGQYTAPKSVIALRLRLSPVISSVLSSSDYMLLFSEEERERVRREVIDRRYARHSEFVTIEELTQLLEIISDEEKIIFAWGWNHTLCKLLKKAGVESSLLPSITALDSLRMLSHRRTTIVFNQELNKLLSLNIPIPKELTDLSEAMSLLEKNPDCFLKSPWSCSGRGVVRTTDLSSSDIKNRIRSTINRQGSIMIENAASKEMDFASEWYINEGVAHFLGLSVFQVSPTGEYKGNIIASQEELAGLIYEATPLWSSDYIDAQKVTLEKIIAPNYSGPVGIDMLVEIDKSIRPCIEVNLRHTMGHVALARHRDWAFGNKI